MNNGHPRISVRRSLAIGDALAATVVTDRLHQLGYECEFQTHPNIHCLLRYQPNISVLSAPTGYAHVDLDRAYEQHPGRRNKHFSEIFIERADEVLRPYGISLGGPLNCRPSLRLPRHIIESAKVKFERYERPWIFIVPKSNSFTVRQVTDTTWSEIGSRIPGTKFWLGTTAAPKPIVDLECRHLDNVIAWLSAADLVVSVDTGPMHIAAALGKQIVALSQSSPPDLHLSDQRDFDSVFPEGNLNCLGCQENICPVNYYMPPCQNFSPELVARKVIQKLNGITEGAVSAVVSIYRPEVGMLNACLTALLDQVQEIIVVSDQAGIVPDGALQHGKIKYIKHRQFNVGYYRKVNRGARATCGKYILFINDDCILDPHAVERMKEVAVEGVGIVSNQLRYPDSTLYYAGKDRNRGEKGWFHRNHRQHLADWKEPIEIENACGCCILVSRKAYYDAGGHDEDFFLFAGDDAFSLQVRSAGYKIIHQPHSTGLHYEHQSVSKTGNLIELLHNDNKPFAKKWGPYLDWNANRLPLGNFDYRKA